MICYLRCQPISEDVRLRKYIEACESQGCEYHALTWDRLGKGMKYKNEIQFERKAAYGKGVLNIGNKFFWQFFLLYNLVRFSNKYSIIHACDFDTIIPALLIKYFFRKKVIYDVYDAFCGLYPNGILHRIIVFFDHLFIRFSDLLILADKERTSEMELKSLPKEKLFIVENVPAIRFKEEVIEWEKKESLSISYVGVFDKYRGLENLLTYVQNNHNCFLNIAGDGMLLQNVKSVAEKCGRIKYWGHVDYQTGLKIMRESDIIMALYYPFTTNHKYAAPNKFYEALYLGKPILTSKGTLVGEKVERLNTGYTIESNYEALEYSLSNLDVDSENYNNKIINAKHLWQKTYRNYFDQYLCKDYIGVITKIIKK